MSKTSPAGIPAYPLPKPCKVSIAQPSLLGFVHNGVIDAFGIRFGASIMRVGFAITILGFNVFCHRSGSATEQSSLWRCATANFTEKEFLEVTKSEKEAKVNNQNT